MVEQVLVADKQRNPAEMHYGVSKVDRYKWKIKDRKGKFLYIAKGLLKFDHVSYQRADINETKVLEIASEWSWVACGAISIAIRDGEYFVMDGQYRTLAALRRSDVLDLPCLAFEVEDVRGEAEGFLRLNTNRKPITSRDKFRAMLTTEDPSAVFVQDLLVLSGRQISNSNNHSARCLSCLLTWAQKKPEILRHMWPVIDDVCGDKAVHVHIVEGLMSLELRMPPGDSLAAPRWRRRLVDIGLDELLESAHRAHAFYGKGGGKMFAAGMLQRLNRGLKNKLEIMGMAEAE